MIKKLLIKIIPKGTPNLWLFPKAISAPNSPGDRRIVKARRSVAHATKAFVRIKKTQTHIAGASRHSMQKSITALNFMCQLVIDRQMSQFKSWCNQYYIVVYHVPQEWACTSYLILLTNSILPLISHANLCG